MKWNLVTTGLLGTLAILCGCKSIPENFPYEGIYAGYYSRGFERSSFHPQGSTERWWLSADKKFEPIVTARDVEIYLVVRGSITQKGDYGHLGAYDRELHVSDVIEFRGVATRPRRF